MDEHMRDAMQPVRQAIRYETRAPGYLWCFSPGFVMKDCLEKEKDFSWKRATSDP
jgi:hypothetical protein